MTLSIRRYPSAALALATIAMALSPAQAAQPPAKLRSDSYVEQARDIAQAQPGPHEGEGRTTAYPFFAQADGFDIVFRQRSLHPGASIGDHTNDKDEIYYVLSGRGELMLDGRRREVGAGDAVLTRRGSRHGLRQLGDEDLTLIVVYRKPAP
ncbi:cupin domain-containing protein [Lysobacter sp. 1R34A]|uniref:cupin domain-containing protein n=1 Tax=Lysobacter sp. 1R34A TaxID=3445786 RepID=UPI003EEDC8C8